MPAHSQTLSRGIQCLEYLARCQEPPTIDELASGLGLHRSVAYRLVRTLEEHRLLQRDSGELRLGLGLLELARSVTDDWEGAARALIRGTSELLGMTVYISVREGADSIVLMTEEPRSSPTTLTYRPGYRHPLSKGADSKAICAAMTRAEFSEFADDPSMPEYDAIDRSREYMFSTGEVFPGISAVSLPVRLPQWGPSSVTAIYVSTTIPRTTIVAELTKARDTLKALRRTGHH